MTPVQKMLYAMAEQRDPPCQRGCDFVEHCRTMVRACEQFRTYVRTGRAVLPPTDISAVTLRAIIDQDV